MSRRDICLESGEIRHRHLPRTLEPFSLTPSSRPPLRSSARHERGGSCGVAVWPNNLLYPRAPRGRYAWAGRFRGPVRGSLAHSTLVFSTGATHRGVGLPVAKHVCRARTNPSPLQRDAYRTRSGFGIGVCGAQPSHTPVLPVLCTHVLARVF